MASSPLKWRNLSPNSVLRLTTERGTLIVVQVVGSFASKRYGPCLKVTVVHAPRTFTKRVILMQVATLSGRDPTQPRYQDFAQTSADTLESGFYVILDDMASDPSPLKVADVAVSHA
jgi:hypothetical protein